MKAENGLNIPQIIIGAVVLLAGVLIYLIDRPPDQTYFVYNSPIGISLHEAIPIGFGPISNCLPSLIHVFSFILMTAGLIAPKKRNYIIICLGWFLVDCAFELGQKLKPWSLKIIPGWFNEIPFLENAKNYFIHGTFDFFDIAAIAVGTAAAYLFLDIAQKRRFLCYQKRK